MIQKEKIGSAVPTIKTPVQKLRFKPGKSDTVVLALLALCLGLRLLESVVPAVFPLRRFLQGLLYIVGGLALMRWAIQGMKWAARRFLWRVRRRMAAVFFFVGVLPVALGGLAAASGMSVLFGTLTAYMADSQVRIHITRLHATAESLLRQLRDAEPRRRADFLQGFAASAAGQFPALEAHASIAGVEFAVPPDLQTAAIPDKLASHGGPVRRGGETLLTALAAAGGDRVLLIVPLGPEYMQRMLPGLGVLAATFAEEADNEEQSILSQIQRALGAGKPLLRAGEIPPPAHPFDWHFGWPIGVSVLDWRTNEVRGGVFFLHTRLSALTRMIFAVQEEWSSRAALRIGYWLLGAFLFSLLISVGVAVSLTRTLTRAVNDLYVGTQHVNRGHFAYRVPISGQDQVSDLSRAFNTMTASIERLVEDSKERERLEAEMDIAREVQAKLFPPEPPQLESLEMLGVCRPARAVSGDFFDYALLSGDRAAISFGDVSGKGISAALVMAALHSTVRAQLSPLAVTAPRQLDRAAAALVERTNRQLCQHTAGNKFSTLFFSIYDEQSGRLSYSNAGHLPPLLIRRGKIEPLDVHGMVVGVFPSADYQCAAVALEPGDLLVAFTDGLTEPENEYGEEYGEERLRELLLRHEDLPTEEIIAAAMNEVVGWTGGPTLQDDMTMLAARRL